MKPLALTATGLAILAVSATPALSAQRPADGMLPVGTAAGGQISSTPGPFPTSLDNYDWNRELARQLRWSIAAKKHFYCFRANVSRTTIKHPVVGKLRTNITCWGAAKNGLPEYRIVLWEDGSWYGKRFL